MTVVDSHRVPERDCRHRWPAERAQEMVRRRRVAAALSAHRAEIAAGRHVAEAAP